MVWDVYSTLEAKTPRLSSRKEREDKGQLREIYRNGSRQRLKKKVSVSLDRELLSVARIVSQRDNKGLSAVLNIMLRRGMGL